ncbi:MAG: DNA recombination protein RmuC [Oscillospiraceae bacterium]|jgi:DNA recombination protein RmuC|nr:DNA recombination protein RmuC [Oscillospiraceae bacterium]
MEIVFAVAGLVIGLAVGFGFAFLMFSRENKLLREKAEERERALAEFHDERLREANDRAEFTEKLAPMRDTLDKMQRKIEELEGQRREQYGSLTSAIRSAQERQGELLKTTTVLATALKSNQVRGHWGEAQLRTIVEATGMVAHVDFAEQASADDKRPDMVINMPHGRSIVLDSKVPAGKFLEASEISDYADENMLANKKALLREHARALRTQIDLLSKKMYWEQAVSPEFTIMFIPSEAMLSAALEADPALLEYAFSKRVALSSPVNLFSVLKTIYFVWQQQAMSDNAKELGEMAAELLRRVGIMARHSAELAVSLDRTVRKYNDFASSLESNVLTQVNRMADRLEKERIAEAKLIEWQPKQYTKPELTAGIDK